MSPNRIDVMFPAKKARYKMNFSSNADRVVLDANSLEPVESAPQFPGFIKGDYFLVTISFEFPKKSSEKEGKVAPAWAGGVIVVAP